MSGGPENRDNNENQGQRTGENAEQTNPTPEIENQRRETGENARRASRNEQENRPQRNEGNNRRNQGNTNQENRPRENENRVQAETPATTPTNRTTENRDTATRQQNAETPTTRRQEQATPNAEQNTPTQTPAQAPTQTPAQRPTPAPATQSQQKNSEGEKSILELLAPTTPEITDLGKAIVFGVKESGKGIGRVGYGVLSPTLGIINSGRKLITDLFNPKRLFKKPGSYFANIPRMGTSAFKAIFNIATSPFTIAGGFYRGFHETFKVFDKKILQEMPFIRHISKHIIVPASEFVNSIISGFDEASYKGYVGLDKLDKKVKAKQFEK